jgi:hypothetical protein
MLPRPTTSEWLAAEKVVKAYGAARKNFRRIQEQLRESGLLQGNDNKVGAAGEFWAIRYYCCRGYRLVEVPRSNNAGYDFRCTQDRGRELRISVKVVSDENVNGTQLPLKKAQNWDVLFVVLLSKDLFPYKRGLATRSQFNRARRDKAIGETPTIARRSLNPAGWITKYGTVEEWR